MKRTCENKMRIKKLIMKEESRYGFQFVSVQRIDGKYALSICKYGAGRGPGDDVVSTDVRKVISLARDINNLHQVVNDALKSKDKSKYEYDGLMYLELETDEGIHIIKRGFKPLNKYMKLMYNLENLCRNAVGEAFDSNVLKQLDKECWNPWRIEMTLNTNNNHTVQSSKKDYKEHNRVLNLHEVDHKTPASILYNRDELVNILSKYAELDFTNEDVDKIQEIYSEIIKSFHSSRYVLNWQEPYMGASVITLLRYSEELGWNVYSAVWCRKPSEKITRLPQLNDDGINEWIVDFIVKYKMYQTELYRRTNNTFLNEALRNGEI